MTSRKLVIVSFLILIIVIAVVLLFTPRNDDTPVAVNNSQAPVKPTIENSINKTKEIFEKASIEDLKLLSAALRTDDILLCEEILDLNTKRNCLGFFLSDEELARLNYLEPIKDEVVSTNNLDLQTDSILNNDFAIVGSTPSNNWFNDFLWLGLVIAIFIIVFYAITDYRHKTQVKHHDKLFIHIKSELKTGKTKAQIKLSLFHVGWKKALVEEAFKKVK